MSGRVMVGRIWLSTKSFDLSVNNWPKLLPFLGLAVLPMMPPSICRLNFRISDQAAGAAGAAGVAAVWAYAGRAAAVTRDAAAAAQRAEWRA